MNIKVISRNVGFALLVSALFMFLSVLVSVANGNDSALTALLISFTITFIVGIFPFIFVRKSPTITLRDGYMIIVLSWLLSFIFGMLPYVLWGGPFTVANAWFESVSGYTTTGATILDNVEQLPDSLLFWRSSTHFIGGLGVVVFLLLIIPNSSPVRLRLTNMELSSLSREGYSTHANKIVKMFAAVYLLMNIAAFFSYWAAGMTPFEAVNHAFSVCASGGFSTRSASIASFGSRWIEGISMFFMLLTSLHFGMIYLSFATRSLKPMRSPVLRFYLLSLLVFILVLTCLLRVDGCAESWGNSLWISAFQIISTASTTGFSLTDNANWPVTAGIVMLFAGLMCGCAGSTSGGVKADRVLVFFKAVQNRVLQVVHPSSVTDVKLGDHVIKQEELSTQMLYVTLYCLFVVLSIFISLLLGVDSLNSFAASVMSMGNVGPALGGLGNMGSFSSISAGAKFLYSMDMFFGRIEIYPILAVLAMIFSRKAK